MTATALPIPSVHTLRVLKPFKYDNCIFAVADNPCGFKVREDGSVAGRAVLQCVEVVGYPCFDTSHFIDNDGKPCKGGITELVGSGFCIDPETGEDIDDLTGYVELVLSPPTIHDVMKKALQVCEHKGWERTWVKAGCYLHLEASEFIEALRGKGDSSPAEEAGDVLFVLLSMMEANGVDLDEALRILDRKMDAQLEE